MTTLKAETISKPEWVDPPILIQFKNQLVKQRYSPQVIPSYVSAARQFWRYLDERNVSVQEVRPSHMAGFLNEKLAQSQQRFGRSP